MAYRKQQSSNNRRQQSSRQSNGRRQQKTKVNYLPLFTIFSNEEKDGRRTLQIKRYETDNGSIEDAINLDQWLYLAEQLYYGDLTLYGALWDSDSKYADMTGNIRFSEEKLEEILEGFEETEEESQPNKKTKPAAKKTSSKQKPASRKPQYEVPEEDEEEYEESTEEDSDDDLTEL